MNHRLSSRSMESTCNRLRLIQFRFSPVNVTLSSSTRISPSRIIGCVQTRMLALQVSMAASTQLSSATSWHPMPTPRQLKLQTRIPLSKRPCTRSLILLLQGYRQLVVQMLPLTLLSRLLSRAARSPSMVLPSSHRQLPSSCRF